MADTSQGKHSYLEYDSLDSGSIIETAAVRLYAEKTPCSSLFS